MKRPPQRPVSLEDLLRLKRAERPPEGFWADFERGLREKQLAALLPRRPWWQRWADAGFARWAGRLVLPLGAAGLIAGIFWVPRPGGESPATPAVAALTVEPERAVATVEPAVEVPAWALPAPAPEAAPVLVEPTAVAVAVTPAVPAREVAPAVGAFNSFLLTWAATGPAEPLVAGSLLGGTKRLEPRSASSRAVVEPLQQMVPPSERRGARMLTAMVSAAAVENGPRATERLASRLSEERLYDQIERFGARGAGVNVRF
jgi:hypothetical protein